MAQGTNKGAPQGKGLQALATHQENYTKAGPKRLQLLWWELP
jgi:hypothetical protein